MTTPSASPHVTSNSSTKAAPTDNAPEVIIVDSDSDEVSCDGGSGTLGHPMVWYSFDGRDRVACGYCDRAFVKKAF